MGETLDDLGHGGNFSDTTPKATPMKETIAKLDFIKIQNFCSTKDNVKRFRGSAEKWGKWSALLVLYILGSLTRVPS